MMRVNVAKTKCNYCGYAFQPRVECPKKCPMCQKHYPLGKPKAARN